MFKANSAFVVEFVTSSATGAAVDADTIPVVTLARNGVDDTSVGMTVTKIDTGRYKASGTLPQAYTGGDSIAISVAATIGGIAAKDVINNGVVDRGLDLTQAIPTSNTAQTVGDALNAARAQGFGKWTLANGTLTLYAGDNSTVVRTFAVSTSGRS